MSNNIFEITKDDEKLLSQKEKELVIKSVQIPNGALTKWVMYYVGYSDKTLREADNFNRTPELMNGLVIKNICLGYYDGKNFVQTIRPNPADKKTFEFPLGLIGLKAMIFLNPKSMTYAKPSLVEPENNDEAKFTYTLYLQTQLGIHIDSTHPLIEGLEFFAFRYLDTWEKDGKTNYNTRLSIYNRAEKYLHDTINKDIKYWNPDEIANLIETINANSSPSRKSNDDDKPPF